MRPDAEAGVRAILHSLVNTAWNNTHAVQFIKHWLRLWLHLLYQHVRRFTAEM